jgi:hypothetical protein
MCDVNITSIIESGKPERRQVRECNSDHIASDLISFEQEMDGTRPPTWRAGAENYSEALNKARTSLPIVPRAALVPPTK